MTPRQVQVLIGVGVLAAIALVVLVVVVVVGWEDPVAAPTSVPISTSSSESVSTTSSSSTAASTSSTTTSSTTSTSTSTTASPSTTTTSTLSARACIGPGAEPTPQIGVVYLDQVLGDFDGSGVSDDRFLLLTGSSGGTWARVELSYGYAAIAPTFTPRASAADARAVNLGGPADLAVVQVVNDGGGGAYLWVFQECEVRLVVPPDLSLLGLRGRMMGFPLVDEPLVKRGLRCLEDRISVTVASSEDGITWWAGAQTLVWDPATGTLHEPPGSGSGLGAVAAFVPLHSPADDALIQAYADFDC